jgi:molybdenum cofactor synthesis domain-containing protein
MGVTSQDLKGGETGIGETLADRKTAAVLIIGNEILSGRTKDTNLNTIALFCEGLGIELKEGRVVADEEDSIIAAVNALRSAYSYVFTTGGIGPTHDDITADCVAKAVGRPLEFNAEAMELLSRTYGAERFNDARKRMARAPVGATLIDNPVSTAPGFMTENVIVMAGIPRVVEGMLESVRPLLTGGPRILTETIATTIPEGDLAEPLAEIQKRFPEVSIGSYPGMRDGRPFNRLVLRSVDSDVLRLAAAEVGILAS